MRNLYYGRISTVDGQSSASQYADAEKQGVAQVDTFIDEGVSGYHVAPADRAEWQKVEHDLRHGGVLYVRWLDRISRRYDELHSTMQRLMSRGVKVVCTMNGMTFDGADTNPMTKAARDAVLAFMCAQGEADYKNRREMADRGIEIAKAAGKYKGRAKSINDAEIAQAVADGAKWADVMERYGVSKSAVARAVRAAKAAAESA
ncbi:recombinase family protein [Paraburkholderia sp. EG286B]|uniref:recombinase family protein n=1 Tax=Paraburkholderia sp. EG286B TaxID=3237011 RepID=UPI0034D1CEDA